MTGNQRSFVLGRRGVLAVAAAGAAALLAACAAPASTPTAASKPAEPAKAGAPTVAAGAPAAAAAAATSAPVAAPATTPVATKPAAATVPAKSKEPVKLRWGLLSPPLEPYARGIIEDYTKANPHVSVTLEIYPGGADYRPKIMTLLAANDLPDITEAPGRLIIDLASRNVMVDLKPFMASDPIVNEAYFDPFFLRIGQYQGKTVALPLSADVQLVLYNKRMFDESKVAYPKDDWKYDDFVDAARKLTKKDGGAVSQWGYTADYYFFAMNHMIGECATPVLDSGSKVNWTSPEALRSLHRQIDPIKDGMFVPPEVQGTLGGFINAFTQGKAAMSYAVRITVPQVRSQLKDDWDAVEVPTGTCRKSPVMGTIGRSITSSSKSRDAAWDFHRYYYLADGGMKRLIPTYTITPPIPKMFDDPAWRSLAPPPTNHRAFENSLKNGTTPQLEIDFSKAAQVDRLLADLFLAASSGRQTVEDAAKDAEAKANKLLAEKS